MSNLGQTIFRGFFVGSACLLVFAPSGALSAQADANAATMTRIPSDRVVLAPQEKAGLAAGAHSGTSLKIFLPDFLLFDPLNNDAHTSFFDGLSQWAQNRTCTVTLTHRKEALYSDSVQTAVAGGDAFDGLAINARDLP